MVIASSIIALISTRQTKGDRHLQLLATAEDQIVSLSHFLSGHDSAERIIDMRISSGLIQDEPDAFCLHFNECRAKFVQESSLIERPAANGCTECPVMNARTQIQRLNDVVCSITVVDVAVDDPDSLHDSFVLKFPGSNEEAVEGTECAP